MAYGNATWGYSSTASYPITVYLDQVTGASTQMYRQSDYYYPSMPQKIHVPVEAEVVPETPMEWLRRRVAEVTDLAHVEI